MPKNRVQLSCEGRIVSAINSISTEKLVSTPKLGRLLAAPVCPIFAVLLICGSLTIASAATISLGQPGTVPAHFEFWHNDKSASTPWSVVPDCAATDGVALEYSSSD